MMEYYSAIKKNTFESILMRWMKLEPIIQSEVSQKEKHQYNILMPIYEIYKDGNDNLIYEIAKETQIQKADIWTLWEKVRVGWFERIALKHVYYHMWNTWPSKFDGWNRALKASALEQPRGMGWGGRWHEVSGLGNTCIPMADSYQCMAKPSTIL